VINPLLTAAGRTDLVSRYAWWNVGIILAASWLAAPFGLIVLAWALAARGVLTIFLFIPAMRVGLGRPVAPLLRLLLLPLAALFCARAAAWVCVAALPAMTLTTQLFVAASVAAVVFGAVLLVLAPQRVLAMGRRLSRALIGRVAVENGFL